MPPPREVAGVDAYEEDTRGSHAMSALLVTAPAPQGPLALASGHRHGAHSRPGVLYRVGAPGRSIDAAATIPLDPPQSVHSAHRVLAHTASVLTSLPAPQ